MTDFLDANAYRLTRSEAGARPTTGPIYANINSDGVLSNFAHGCLCGPDEGCGCGGRHTVPPPGYSRVSITELPSGNCGEAGWIFEQTGVDEHGMPQGKPVPEPASLSLWVKRRVVQLTRDRQALVAAAAARPDLDYSAEIAAIDAEVAAL